MLERANVNVAKSSAFFMVVWFIIVKKICRYGHSILNAPIDILCMFDVGCPLGLYERCGKDIMYFRIMRIFLRKNAVFLCWCFIFMVLCSTEKIRLSLHKICLITR